MSVRTRVDAPRREVRETPRRSGRGAAPAAPRRVEQAERVKSGAAQRAYARRHNRSERGRRLPPLPGRAASAMAGRLPFVSAILALLGCGLVLTLLLTTRAAEDSYQLGDARQTNRHLEDERAALQREVAAADSAPELANRARELGMVPAQDPSRLLVAPDGTVTVVGAETPEQGPPAPPLNTSPAAPTPVPRLARAQGEQLVPVPSTPGPGQNPAETSQRVGHSVPGQAPEAGQVPAGDQAPDGNAAAPVPAAPDQAAAPADSAVRAPADAPAPVAAEPPLLGAAPGTAPDMPSQAGTPAPGPSAEPTETPAPVPDEGVR
ncbi:hypothetical protein [Nocardia sp. BMG51109]|uniref:hypothetical protein n=1 Tax=Nocardia sp. BMG51109 TaxID=1056816 RepID=UPI0004662905|nr:hypothetical protein [Nocardia sp. BMG51109]